MRLTQKDAQGNWSLKDVRWSDLCAGRTITREVSEKLYGALWKLMEYEDTGLTPEQVQELKERDVAKKPKDIRNLRALNGSVYQILGVCPECGSGVNNRMRFCDICGQKLKWED